MKKPVTAGRIRVRAPLRGAHFIVAALAITCGMLLVGCSSPTPPSDEGPADSAAVSPTDEAGPRGEATSGSGAEPASDVQAPPTEAAESPLPTATATRMPTTLVSGRVTDSEGRPITDVSVAIVESTVPVPEMAIFTDASGSYTWYVEPGTYTLEAYRDGYVTQEAEISVEEGAAAELDFQLEAR